MDNLSSTNAIVRLLITAVKAAVAAAETPTPMAETFPCFGSIDNLTSLFFFPEANLSTIIKTDNSETSNYLIEIFVKHFREAKESSEDYLGKDT